MHKNSEAKIFSYGALKNQSKRSFLFNMYIRQIVELNMLIDRLEMESRKAIKRISKKLKQVVGQYNDSFHKGIGMSPYEAYKSNIMIKLNVMLEKMLLNLHMILMKSLKLVNKFCYKMKTKLTKWIKNLLEKQLFLTSKV
ncbi:hypothetical protein M153_3748000828 [Pseudoloma neurophilia]|uniref:Uncharacterized protein n=1 Tax=Pseudoloma neurophilia TaxID=146866 RepID=A0A0R0M1K5_9MICR|nr:hypothetical protein M153_3748000828 [Pseudoloma neurophilia]